VRMGYMKCEQGKATGIVILRHPATDRTAP
jgi:hypothetical protein